MSAFRLSRGLFFCLLLSVGEPVTIRASTSSQCRLSTFCSCLTYGPHSLPPLLLKLPRFFRSPACPKSPRIQFIGGPSPPPPGLDPRIFLLSFYVTCFLLSTECKSRPPYFYVEVGLSQGSLKLSSPLGLRMQLKVPSPPLAFPSYVKPLSWAWTLLTISLLVTLEPDFFRGFSFSVHSPKFPLFFFSLRPPTPFQKFPLWSLPIFSRNKSVCRSIFLSASLHFVRAVPAPVP